MLTALPSSAIDALEAVRPFAEHAAELGWRFAVSEASVYVAEHGAVGRRKR